MKQFHYRIGNIEARPAHTTESLEIVQWNDSMCWTIVRFERLEMNGNNKYNAVFIDRRPFDALVNWKDLGKLLQYSYDFLNGDEE